jgi:hypothetical protein
MYIKVVAFTTTGNTLTPVRERVKIIVAAKRVPIKNGFVMFSGTASDNVATPNNHSPSKLIKVITTMFIKKDTEIDISSILCTSPIVKPRLSNKIKNGYRSTTNTM